MDAQKVPISGDLEVTGISRSGRVRKKSSKLMDFQSPDDIEPKVKKTTINKPAQNNKQVSNVQAVPQQQQQNHQQQSPFVLTSHVTNAPTPTHSSETHSDDDLSGEDFAVVDNDDSVESDEDSDEIDAENIDEEYTDDGIIDPIVKQSIYMTEKANKKKVMKDGKIVYSKAQRKDKGKTRFTAYMLWAKDVRKQMLAQQPDLDFAAISRRLGEMWANVPTNEKCSWKKRAKRLATKTKNTDRSEVTKSSKFLNRNSTALSNNRSKKISENSPHNEPIEAITLLQQNQITTKTSPMSTSGAYKVTGIDPVDVAAHLRLLGESLSIIGERLKEHEGQITVSGSLSVLLDSLLCSIGPLMCLTSQIPGFNENNQHLKDSLQNTLDNIAYVMPGL